MSRFCKIIGHKFRPRYSRTWPNMAFELNTSYPPTIEAFKNVTYHGDVCQRCGAVVNAQVTQ